MDWRLLSDDDHSAAWNMALDQAILDAVSLGLSPPTLRHYGWAEPSVSVGRFQDVARDIDLEFCSDHNIPIVRRPTGGRGIFHSGDLTFTLVVRDRDLLESSVSGIYRQLAEGLTAAFHQLGLQLGQGTCERRPARSGDCFLQKSTADLVTQEGDKLVGSALRRMGGAVLVQCSVRYKPPTLPSAAVFTGPKGQESYPLEGLHARAVRSAIEEGIRAAFRGVRFVKGAVLGWEEERAAALLSAVSIAENRGTEVVGDEVPATAARLR